MLLYIQTIQEKELWQASAHGDIHNQLTLTLSVSHQQSNATFNIENAWERMGTHPGFTYNLQV